MPAIALAADGDAKMSALEASIREFIPILILLVVVGLVLARLPRVEGVEHTDAFRRRRVMNWLPLGLTYAFLYMGRYNLTVSKRAFEQIAAADGTAMMSNADFGTIFAIGTFVYGFSFVVNGPLTDRFGGKLAILVGGFGAAVVNLAMGLCTLALVHDWSWAPVVARNFVLVFSVLYGANMYFQSFGAVAIVKVNAPWFHVRERGVFGAIFGILISLGVYFAFDWGKLILNYAGIEWVFLVPAALLILLCTCDVFTVANTPSDAGHADFDTADASSGDDGPRLGVGTVFLRMMRNPVIVTIACIEFCSGWLRQSIMQWYQTFAKQTDGVLELRGSFINEHWGMVLCIAGILGGMFAGIVSDRVFGSRRGPVALFLYLMMLGGAAIMSFTYDTWLVGPLVAVMSMAIIGVHGMLSGTASMDFGGRKNVGVAVGIIDGFVYLGTAAMSATYAFILPQEQLDDAGHLVGPATDPANWQSWPVSMVIVAVVGAILASRVWNATPQRKK